MKKIVFLEIVQSFGGARKSTLELAKGLSQDYNVEIWDLNGTCQPFVDACKSYGVKLRILDKREKALVISSGGFFKKLCNALTFFIRCIRVNKIIRRETKYMPHTFIVNNSKALTLLFRKPSQSIIILFARGWFTPMQILKKDKLLYERLVDKYVCVSEATRHALYCANVSSLENLFVVHNAIDLPVCFTNKTLLPRTHSLQLLFSGGFLPTKGQHVALDIAEILASEGVNFKIVICGIIYPSVSSQHWYNYVVNEISKRKLSKYIELVVNQNNVIEYFHWCDIFVHPSDTEGLPRVVMEAMAMKKPVVANAVGGVTDYILNNFTGCLVRHNHIGDYVDAIMHLYNDKTFYNELADRAYSLLETEYTRERQIKAMKTVLN